MGKQIGLAVHQAMADAASLRDAKLRRVVEKVHGATVADGLAGNALAALAKQCQQEGLSANSHSMEAGAPDPKQYFGEVAG